MSRVPGWARGLRPDPGTLRQDGLAGVPGAIASVPDGMASAVLVGVNPMYGPYASMAGPIGGGLAVSTRLMVVTTTTAAALAAGSTMGAFSGADRPEAAVRGRAPVPQRREPDLLDQLRRSHRLDLRDAVTVVPAADTILESTQQAYDDAEVWLAVHATSARR